MASFAIEKLETSSAEALAQITDRFRFMPENEPLCRSVLDRLEFLHSAVALNPDDKLRTDYTDILVRLLRLLAKKKRLLLVRLAKSDTIVQLLLDLHSRVDKIVDELELSGVEEMEHWKAGWQSHCTRQHEVLKQEVTAKSERLLVKGLKGDKEPRELLMALRMAVDGKLEAPEMLELKATTFDRVASYLAMEGTSAYDGFIALESVEFEDEAIGFGTYGVPRRGSWVDRGQRQDVVVKLLFDETKNDVEAAFLEQLHFWYNLPSDEHILKLYGGNHITSPPFFVCEDAHNGNLFDFLYEDDNRGQFWPMFLQLTKGLKFLHDRNIVHGGLKCNNALIGQGNVVKLTDFDFSCIRSLSLGLSENGGRAQSRAVRYQPKEVVNKLGNEKPKLEFDMYALGMCIIEAFTREPPFGYVDDDTEIVAMIKRGELPSRPNGLSDVEWSFITSLCAEDYTQRPTVDKALVTIQGLVGATAIGD